MNISNIKVQHLCIPFAASFQHASAIRNQGDSLLVTVLTDQGTVGYGEGCPREYVTGETSQSAAGFVYRVEKLIIGDIHEFADLEAWVRENEKTVDENPAAWCALELALIDAMAKELCISAESMLGLQPTQNEMYRYSAVIGAGSLADLKKYLGAYRQLQFQDFKIKLSGDLDIDSKRIEHFAQTTSSSRLRLDANNLWSDPYTAASYLDQLPDVFFAIEEPLVAKDFSGLRRLLTLTDKKVILDESFTCGDDVAWLLENGRQCIANIRVSKMGGLVRSRDRAEMAEAGRLSYIDGAHVGEGSLLTRAAMLVGRNESEHLVAREGAAGEYLLRNDICRHSLRFSQGGICRYTDTAPGLGCEVKTKTLSRYPEILPVSPIIMNSVDMPLQL